FWACWSRLEKVAAQAYIVGPELEDGLRACRAMAKANKAATLCYWVSAEETPENVTSAYLKAIDALSKEKFDAYLSLKAHTIGFDPQMLSHILEQGERHRLRFHFDS